LDEENRLITTELGKQRKSNAYRFVRVLDRMIAWDLLKTVSAVLSIMVIIIVSRKFIKILTLAIDGTISGSTAIDILGLKTIVVIVNFLPAAIFMAILMVLGRMYRDQEMSAIASAGGGAITLYRAVFLLMLPLSIVTAGLSLYAAPWAEKQTLLLTSKDMETADLRGIAAGRFTEYSHGDLVFYTEEIDSHLQMHNIFIQDRQHDKLNIINAKHGRLKELPSGKYVVLEKGERSQGTPGTGDFILETFNEYAVRIDKKTTPVDYDLEAIETQKLLNSDKISDRVELQRRLSAPLGVLFLSFLAVPLAKLSPRGGVYGSLIFAFLIYFIYGNINQINYSWVLHEFIPIWFGYIWVYLFLSLLGIGMLIRLYGWAWILGNLKTGAKR
jgi:lipopolysaccharide export system permease protein